MATSRDAALARVIARRSDLDPSELRRIEGGFDNHVFAVGSGDDRAVIRFAIDDSDPDAFGIEQWCLEQAPLVGIPSPRVLARGEIDGVPYLVQSFVAGRSGGDSPPDEAWRRLGAYASLVARMPTGDAPADLFGRFGRDLRVAWQRHLSYNLGELTRGDPLIDLGVYSVDQQEVLIEAVTRLAEREFEFGLCHGDLAPRNLLVPEDGDAVLIDWGAAVTGPAPWGDVETVYRWHVTDGSPELAHVEQFARACGIDLERELPTLEAMLLLRSLDLVRWATDQRPGLIDRYSAAATSAVQRYLRLAH